MRINKLVAERMGIARRKADEIIRRGRVTIDGRIVMPGEQVESSTLIAVDGKSIAAIATDKTMLLFHKPAGFVCSRQAQGGDKTIYSLLPKEYHHLNPVGRLDKDSAGLLLLTNDGDLAYALSHPKFKKTKVYVVVLDKPLLMSDESAIQQGVQLQDGISKLELKNLDEKGLEWQVTMHEGRNRQIRRTFAQRSYGVKELMRTEFGPYSLDGLPRGGVKLVQSIK